MKSDKITRSNQKVSTCNRLDLEILGSRPIRHKHLPLRTLHTHELTTLHIVYSITKIYSSCTILIVNRPWCVTTTKSEPNIVCHFSCKKLGIIDLQGKATPFTNIQNWHFFGNGKRLRHVREGGYLPCRKYYKVWYSSKIKVNACILIHLVNNYEFWGELFKFTQFYFIMHFPPYTPSNQFLKLHIGYVGSVTFNLANLQSHPSKFI
jgi:hypothetical protein